MSDEELVSWKAAILDGADAVKFDAALHALRGVGLNNSTALQIGCFLLAEYMVRGPSATDLPHVREAIHAIIDELKVSGRAGWGWGAV